MECFLMRILTQKLDLHDIYFFFTHMSLEFATANIDLFLEIGLVSFGDVFSYRF
jgi:hypothetical protein